MKKLLIISLLFIYFTTNSQNSGIVEYGIKLTPTDSKKIKNTDEIDESFKKIEEKVTELVIELQFNNTYGYSKLLKPEPITNHDEFVINMATILSGAKGSYFTSIKDNTFINNEEFVGDLYLISSEIKRDEWKITEEKIKIGNYNCLKATREFEFRGGRGEKSKIIQEVWFAPQIPVMFGPKDFVGFPGLVIKVKDGTREYIARKIRLNPSKKVSIKKPTKGKKITKKEFEKVVAEQSSYYRKKSK